LTDGEPAVQTVKSGLKELDRLTSAKSGLMKRISLAAALAVAALGGVASAFGPPGLVLYTENFDSDASSSWSNNTTLQGLDGQFMDAAADFFFDYSAIGIPPAPNSSGATTRGMKLQANLIASNFGGFSVSPMGQNFTGDYKLEFDMWSSYTGPLNTANAGATNLSFAGVLTDGRTNNMPGLVDGVWFAMTADGRSAADYRAYSPDRPVSYQIPPLEPADEAAAYFAGSRNHTADYYQTQINAGVPFGDGIVMAPPAQLALFPDQTGFVPTGVAGMTWRRHIIRKLGARVSWSIDGVPIAEVDVSKFVSATTGGNNILFGHSDVNAGSSPNPLAADLLFTLVDNVKVTAIPEATQVSLAAIGLGAAAAALRRRRSESCARKPTSFAS
jgi:hypothetical protein